ncbi:HNH endonuclease signature motif containing protein [Aeromicrobium wangtongii]|uniref:HNH endonuclease n=1 Tax=Aeromicrobium wangtongii TaxID=2969247 RepID=A0ABY5MC08_9ACTN|nr:HNH endonuclease signature motif containing protein [Aeromicrobium wangtongii]MCD9196708.1 HNH endonuclease [Aeromicrobium wangtongii]UUP14218.1 HNH endonuclease [Aeromicrobium wangtongii]
MATTTAPTTQSLSHAVRWQSMAEARTVEAMIDYRDAEMARTALIESSLRRKIERSAIALTIGEATGMSEAQVQLRLSIADRVRAKTPQVWDAFIDGRLDFSRVRDISAAIEKLRRDESIARLDNRVLAYATSHTGAELRQWLRRFVQRVEADLAVERAEAERAERHVSVAHGDDAMAWLNAYLPSHLAAAIEARLRTAARKPADPDDDRTVAQREADLLVAWCTSSDAATSAVDANIAVTVAADVLAGAAAGFAESTDGRWAVPASWIADVAATGSTFWHRIVVDPVKDDVLSHEYLGRFAPDTLAAALQFLHGVCQAPGCMVPAERCDLDHRIPHPHGPTTGDNMGPLCRRHHNLKGHGLLHWSTSQPRPPTKPMVIEIYQPAPTIDVEYVPA